MSSLSVSASPHARAKSSVTKIMLCVLLALLPAAVAGVLYFGEHAMKLLLTTTASAMLFEFLCRLITRKSQTVSDLSAAVTGLLLGMSLPPDLPLWQGAAGSFAAIVIVKQLFGGIGRNFANPALTARVILLLCFHQTMTTWRMPHTDAVSAATPLVSGSASYWDLFLGNAAGCIGETCAAALMLGGIFLMLTGIVSPAAPLAYLGSFALLTWVGGYDIPGQLLSGGLMLGAFFMATDYTTTPLTVSGKLIFGVCCGCLTFFIRHFGGYPEGVALAILLMNLLTPALDRLTAPVPFGTSGIGTEKQKKRKAAKA